MSIALISHPDCLLHDMGESHPEQAARLQVIFEELVRAGLMDGLKPYLAPLATREQLLRAHSPDYVDAIFAASPKTGLVSLDPDTFMNSHSLTAALRAAGAAILAVRLVISGEVNSAFCNVRPPGHHAERAKAMGFCFFNNVAVAVMHALDHFKLKRIAIIDFDVHHGNGTENIFRQDERVLYCSSFQHPFYPFDGADTVSPHILNIPLPAGADGKVFREKIVEYWLPRIALFEPEMIFFSAGFDAYLFDEMSDLLLTEDDYAWVTAEIRKLADTYAHGRMVSVLEGGYELEGLGRCVAAHIRALGATTDK
ncbi:MAG: histone deacetylase family protein [Gammaproteobacteria bacterium]|nr:histone deacetylase family protein [Gammaproteobacteria bacterium]